MRILLADDQPYVRSALALLLEHEPDLQVVGEAADADELFYQIKKTRPDLILLDWELPGLPAIDLLRAIRLNAPGLVVIALSGRPEAYQTALIAGVDDFVSKGYPPEQLLSLLHALNGGTHERISEAPVKQWMTKHVITVTPDSSLSQADHLMAEHHVRRLPVVKEEQVLGVITRNDIRKAPPNAPQLLSMGEISHRRAQLVVEQVMSSPPYTISERATIRKAARLMRRRHIGSLPVLDPAGRLVGIITESDIFRAITHEWMKGATRYLNQAIKEGNPYEK